MTEKSKPKRKVVERRQPGIKAMPAPPPRSLPTDHLAKSLFKEVAEAERTEAERAASTTGTTPTTPTTPTTGPTPTTPIAPVRDFTRVANSIVREAVPAGFFTGKSKQLYDYLYQQTRGAITPARSCRITMERLMVGADIGSDRTLRKNLRRLIEVGLVSVTEVGGTQGGNEFTIFTPEELTPTTPTTPTTHHPYPLQKVGGVRVVESGRGRGGLSEEANTTYATPKTFLKTPEIDDDDEAFAGLNASLKQAIKEVTGRDLSTEDAARLKEIGELLATELKIAAARTTVSSGPAFLAEHLRRRLWKKDRQQIERELGEASTAEPAKTSATEKAHLDHEQLQEEVNRMVTLLREGQTIEGLDAEHASQYRPIQWHMIRSMALTQVGSKS